MISLFRIFSGSSLIKQLRGLVFFQQSMVRVDRFQRGSQLAHILGGHTSFDRFGEKLGLQISRKGLPFANSLVSIGPNSARPCKTSSQSCRKIASHKPPRFNTSPDTTILSKRGQHSNFPLRQCDPILHFALEVNVTYVLESIHYLRVLQHPQIMCPAMGSRSDRRASEHELATCEHIDESIRKRKIL